MRQLIRRYFPKKSLEGLSNETWVAVKGVVVSDDITTSPLTSFKAAAFRITWVEGVAVANDESRAGTKFSDAIATAWMGKDLRVRCGERTVLVSLEGLRLTAHYDPDDATPVSGGLPAEFHYLLERKSRGALYYREHAMHSGDPVIVRGLVRPAERGGGYRASARESATADFVIGPKSGAKLIDLSAES